MQYLLILIGCDGETTLFLFVPLRFTQHALTTYQSFRFSWFSTAASNLIIRNMVIIFTAYHNIKKLYISPTQCPFRRVRKIAEKRLLASLCLSVRVQQLAPD